MVTKFLGLEAPDVGKGPYVEDCARLLEFAIMASDSYAAGRRAAPTLL